MKYGLYYYKNTHNLGDDMWAYAQSLFYPNIDYLIDNTTLYKFKSECNESVASIFSAFIEPYNSEYAFFPPENIIPLFIGAYFRPTMYEYLDSQLMQSYLSLHSPIGCRSKEIAERFNNSGINAYFSGCISMTLPDLQKTKGDYICLVDLPNHISEYIMKKVGNKFKIKYMSHVIDNINSHSQLDIEERFDIIRKLLEIYAGAHCVITSRLHAALPCLTQNTPVLLTVTNDNMIGVNHIERRIKDFYPFLHHNNYSDFLDDNVDYNFIDPPPNPKTYLKYRKDLINKCQNFINECESDEIYRNMPLNNQTNSKDELIDILQNKIKQLKSVIDQKNDSITILEKQKTEMKKSVLSVQSRLRKYETFNEWENIEYFGDWEGRSFAMSKFIPSECRSLLDLGCGEMHIRKFLPKTTKYYGCDYKKRDNDTIICDLAKDDFPDIQTDIIFISGVFEYLTNWKSVFYQCSQHCNQILMSYSTIESAPIRDPIWVNSISYQEIIDEANKCGFKLSDYDRYNTSDILNFVKE